MHAFILLEIPQKNHDGRDTGSNMSFWESEFKKKKKLVLN